MSLAPTGCRSMQLWYKTMSYISLYFLSTVKLGNHTGDSAPSGLLVKRLADYTDVNTLAVL